MKKETISIISIVIINCLIMNWIDGVIQPPYFLKSLIKIILFFFIPLFYYATTHQFSSLKSLFQFKRKALSVSLLLGISIYSIILLAYFLFSNWFDFSNIASQLITNAQVNPDNFIYVSIYISLINSLLEEFFFRGFSFNLLKEKSSRKWAYIFSSLLFSIYHVGMTSGWFNFPLFLLMTLSLALGGCLFNTLNEHYQSLYPSWLVHMFANFAINTVGFLLFNLI